MNQKEMSYIIPIISTAIFVFILTLLLVSLSITSNQEQYCNKQLGGIIKYDSGDTSNWYCIFNNTINPIICDINNKCALYEENEIYDLGFKDGYKAMIMKIRYE